MPADLPRLAQRPRPGARVHGHGLADDEAIADELADGLAGVGVADLVDLVRVQPDLALAAADHGGGEALLRTEVDPVESGRSSAGFGCDGAADGSGNSEAGGSRD